MSLFMSLLHVVDPKMNLKMKAVGAQKGLILSGLQCSSVSSERLRGVFGYGLRKTVEELSFWGAPGIAFGSPWADTVLLWGLLGSALGDIPLGCKINGTNRCHNRCRRNDEQ